MGDVIGIGGGKISQGDVGDDLLTRVHASINESAGVARSFVIITETDDGGLMIESHSIVEMDIPRLVGIVHMAAKLAMEVE